MDGVGFIYESAKTLNLNEEDVMTQLTNYRAKEGIWEKEYFWVACGKVKPTVWWKSFFGHTALGRMAEKILTVPLSSAATERSFSTFGNTHTKKRNRLTTERSGKITFISHNYKLMNAESKEAEPPIKRMRLMDEMDSDDDSD